MKEARRDPKTVHSNCVTRHAGKLHIRARIGRHRFETVVACPHVAKIEWIERKPRKGFSGHEDPRQLLWLAVRQGRQQDALDNTKKSAGCACAKSQPK